jgi:hypothetical protein
MHIRLLASPTRSITAGQAAELKYVERAVATGTRQAGHGLKTEFRRQVGSAVLGQRLANSWRDRHYHNQKLDAARLAYTKVPQIVRAFDEDAVIRSRHRRFLAIPLTPIEARRPRLVRLMATRAGTRGGRRVRRRSSPRRSP